jgi:hypothetical protein
VLVDAGLSSRELVARMRAAEIDPIRFTRFC